MQKYIEVHEEAAVSQPVYTLGIASRLSGIPAHSIRQYISEGLLIPYKLESRRHLFSPYDVERLKLIQHLIREKGLNFSGMRTLIATVPCWQVRDCPEAVRDNCGALSDIFFPCWMASEKGSACKNENCRDCEVYRSLDRYSTDHSLKGSL